MATTALLAGIKCPQRHPQAPRVLSPEEVERLLTVGTAGDPLARALLMTVYGCGLRLSEATHVRVATTPLTRTSVPAWATP